MKNVGPAPNRIQGTASQVNQEVVTGGTFHTPSNLLVEQVLCEYPGKAAGRCHRQLGAAEEALQLRATAQLDGCRRAFLQELDHEVERFHVGRVIGLRRVPMPATTSTRSRSTKASTTSP